MTASKGLEEGPSKLKKEPGQKKIRYENEVGGLKNMKEASMPEAQ